jgi:hypothetical protein
MKEVLAITKAIATRRGQQFLAKFKEQNGSLLCRDLLGCDISTEEGHRQFVEKGLVRTVCTKAIKDAVEMIQAVLAQEKPNGKP